MPPSHRRPHASLTGENSSSSTVSPPAGTLLAYSSRKLSSFGSRGKRSIVGATKAPLRRAAREVARIWGKGRSKKEDLPQLEDSLTAHSTINAYESSEKINPWRVDDQMEEGEEELKAETHLSSLGLSQEEVNRMRFNDVLRRVMSRRAEGKVVVPARFHESFESSRDRSRHDDEDTFFSCSSEAGSTSTRWTKMGKKLYHKIHDPFEENDLALQIEAMAREADVAFERLQLGGSRAAELLGMFGPSVWSPYHNMYRKYILDK